MSSFLALLVTIVASCHSTEAFRSLSSRLSQSALQMVDVAPYTGSDPVTARGTLLVKDLRSLSVKEALNAVCGSMKDLEEKHKFHNTDIAKKAPTVCTYVIANPKAFFEKPRMAKAYGVDVDNIDLKTPLTELAKILPVIYVADVHTEYGTLGYQLNSKSANTMNDISPELRSFRQTPVYLGGQQNKGSSFTMVHNKVGFPDNRGWRGLPGNTEFRLFFSPNTAMANELCMTKDALPTDFKFFQWATVWLPNQLPLEYDQKLWLSVTAPVSLLFDDKDNDVYPLWGRVVSSFPTDRLKSPAKKSSAAAALPSSSSDELHKSRSGGGGGGGGSEEYSSDEN